MIRSFDDPAGKNPRVPGPRSLLLSIERALAAKSNQPSDRAQDLFYQAMEAPSETEQIKLLEKALELDAGNVDVLLVLQRYENFSPAEEIQFLQNLVQLAERRLGTKAFKDFTGMFWGFHETRPYMRARERLAEALLRAGRTAEAIAEWNGMLKLNPNDNQGIRYLLLPAVLRLNQLEAARKLFEAYPDEFEFSVVFAWGRVLERFLAEDLPGAAAALAVARKQNAHMQVYVKGHRPIPKTMPASYAPGSKEEAVCFADVLRAAWGQHPAALKWLAAQKTTR